MSEKMSEEERSYKAASVYLVKRGYTILDNEFMDNSGTRWLVARDDDGDEPCTVFFIVGHSRDSKNGIPSVMVSRTEFEMAAAEWLSVNGSDSFVRADEISMVVVSDKNALLRHHTNCFASKDQ